MVMMVRRPTEHDLLPFPKIAPVRGSKSNLGLVVGQSVVVHPFEEPELQRIDARQSGRAIVVEELKIGKELHRSFERLASLAYIRRDDRGILLPS